MKNLSLLIGIVMLMVSTTHSGRKRAWSKKESSDSRDWYDSESKDYDKYYKDSKDYYKDSKPDYYKSKEYDSKPAYYKDSKSKDSGWKKPAPKPTPKPTKKPTPKPVKPPKPGKCYPGVIQGFFGKLEDIPGGFILCDGSKGTPDLRDRFLVGAGHAFEFGDEGGATEVEIKPENVPPHKHGSGTLVTDEAGEHNHHFQAVTNEGGHFHNQIDLEIGKNGQHVHNIELETEKDGDHNHKFDAFVPEDYSTYHSDFDVPLQKIDLDKSYPIEVSDDPGHKHVIHGDTSDEGEHAHDLDGTVGGKDDGIHFHTVTGTTDDDGIHVHEISGETDEVGGGKPIHILPPFYSVYWICCVEEDDKKYEWYKN